jgi:hypothetical protein
MARIIKMPGLRVVNDSVGRAMLVETSEAIARKLRAELKGWLVADEVIHPRPDLPRVKVNSPSCGGGATDSTLDEDLPESPTR